LQEYLIDANDLSYLSNKIKTVIHEYKYTCANKSLFL